MAEMGLGYGSEYHLLRYLGHHRNELNHIIRTNTTLKGKLKWIDFPKNPKKLSLDGEYTGIRFLKDNSFKEIFTDTQIQLLDAGWNKYWPVKGSQQNLDGVILHYNEDKVELIIVEAKARLGELKSKTKSSSNATIQSAFQETQQNLNITNANWFYKYYQLSNRLGLINYLNNHSHVQVKASLLYIYFINGFEKRELIGQKIYPVFNKSVKSKKDWEDAIKIQYENLGITEIANQYIAKVFIDCK